MLLESPKDYAITSIRLVITELLHTNRVLLAHELVYVLDKQLRNVNGASSTSLYPSWYCRGTLGPDRPGSSNAAQQDSSGEIARQLWTAIFYLDAAHMHQAATSCEAFGVRHKLNDLAEASTAEFDYVDLLDAAWLER